MINVKAQSDEPYVVTNGVALSLSAMPDSGVVIVAGKNRSRLPCRVREVWYPSGESRFLSLASSRIEEPSFLYQIGDQNFGLNNNRTVNLNLAPDSVRIYRLDSLTYEQIFVASPSNLSSLSLSNFPASAAKSLSASFFLVDNTSAGFYRESDGLSLRFSTGFDSVGYTETVSPHSASIVGEGVVVYSLDSKFTVREFDIDGTAISSDDYIGEYLGAWSDDNQVYLFCKTGYYIYGNPAIVSYPSSILEANKMFRAGEVAVLRSSIGSLFSFSELDGWGNVSTSDCNDLLSVIKQPEGWYALYTSYGNYNRYPNFLYFNPDSIASLIRNPILVDNVVDSATVSFDCRQFEPNGRYFKIASVTIFGEISIRNSLLDTVFSSVMVLATSQSEYDSIWYSYLTSTELVFEDVAYDSLYSMPYVVRGEFGYTEDDLDTLVGIEAYVEYIDGKPVVFASRSQVENRYLARDISADPRTLPCRSEYDPTYSINQNPDTSVVFKIWPNPSAKSITISNNYPIAKVQVYDFAGRLLLDFNTPETQFLNLDLDLPTGTYRVVLFDTLMNEKQSTLIIRRQ